MVLTKKDAFKRKRYQWTRDFLFKRRLMAANLTKNSASSWMFLFHFAIEKYYLLLNMGSRIDFIEVDSNYSNIGLTTYLFLTNLFLVHSSQ